jgi:plastocyanin
MNRKLRLGFVLAAAGLLCSCDSSVNPASPTAFSSSANGSSSGTNGGSTTSTTISIEGNLGNQSFSPPFSIVPAGQTVVFTNLDPTTTHHIVQDGGGFDTGNLGPGGTSLTIPIPSTAAITFHCAIHPTMVGSINGSTGSPSPGPAY